MLFKNRERIFMYPLENVSQLVIMGRIELSTAMLGILMRSGIDTVFLTRDGRYKGRIVGETSKNIFIREKQFLRRQDANFCLNVSRSIIEAKFKNCRNLIQKLNKTVFQDVRNRFENALKNVQSVTDISLLRGMEGSFAAFYFKQFTRLLKESFGFTRRIKHPPPDPLNILLSLGYTLLFNTLYALVEAAGFDPYAGFFHQSSYGHPALVSDLMEPYRAPIVDRLIVRAINKQEITPEHFVREEREWKLTTAGLEKFVGFYQQQLKQRITINQQSQSIWHILQNDVWQFQKYIEGESQNFSPFIFR